MQSYDEGFMRQALEMAELALASNVIPVGALFVKSGRIIARGVKNRMTHPHFDHAEHNGCYEALWSREGPQNLAGVDVYSTLEPCIMCMSMLMTTRVERIVYGLDDPYGGGAWMLHHPEHLPERFHDRRPRLEKGLLAKESKSLLREFFLRQKGTDAKHWDDANNPLVKLCLSE